MHSTTLENFQKNKVSNQVKITSSTEDRFGKGKLNWIVTSIIASKCHILNVCPFLSFRFPSLSRSNSLEREGDTFRTTVISHSNGHFLLGTKCAKCDSVFYRTILIKKFCYCIEEHRFKIRKNCNNVNVIVITARNTSQTKHVRKAIFFYSGRAKNCRNKTATK